jgi:ketosteroid isomerase-like protein
VRALGLLSSNATTGVNERSSAAALASAPKTTSAQESSMTDRDIRAALDQHWAASDANDFELEHQIYREDAVLEYPQSGERIRGRRNIQITRSLQPSRKRFKVRRVIGRGDLWVSEYVILYDGQPSYTVSIMEFEGGKVTRETQYFGDPFEASAWRSPWVEPMERERSVR